MDVNGLRFWQVADAAGFGLGPDSAAAEGLFWRADARLLRLDRQQPAPALTEDGVAARDWASRPSPTRDPAGSYAWWDLAGGQLLAAGFGEDPTPLALPPDTPVGIPRPTDLAFGDDDVLYVARNEAVMMLDRRSRWSPVKVAAPGFSADRLAPAPGGGAWALDRAAGRLARLRGAPMGPSGFHPDPEDRFRPVELNPRPPLLRPLAAARVPAGCEAIAIAASPGGRLALLAWRAGEDAVLFTLEERRLVRRFSTQGLRFPYALAWIGEDQVALLAIDKGAPARQAFVYALDAPPSDTAAALPSGDVHPLQAPARTGFANALSPVPYYATLGASPDAPGALRALRALSRATYAAGGRVTLGPFDCGRPGGVWHRLYLEASIPDYAGVRIWAHADDAGGRPAAPGQAGAPAWAPHLFGAAVALAEVPDAPRGAWCDEPSERPFHPGLSPCPRAPGRSGLFTAAMQQAGRKVRRIEGRYLWLHLELVGDGRATPEIAALRVYGQRLSYRDRYLPALYHEELSGPDAQAPGAATPQDFLERLLTLFEGPLTQLEDRIAGAWLLTDPAAAPEAALPWLGAWIGLAADPADSADRFRQALRAAPWTAAMHGALGGLMAELEIATGGVVMDGGRIDRLGEVPRPGQLALASLEGVETRALMLATRGEEAIVLAGGAVTRGEIVIVEGYRLRRTFATILGADLGEPDDPLTLGLSGSGNSFVGDTLFLGGEAQRELLALFRADLPQSAADRAAVAAFFERLAHRVMVLVRKTPRTGDLARLDGVARAAAPAHVEVSVLTASRPLIVGAASLVGIDTYLAEIPGPGTFRVGRSVVGGGDQVRGTGRLDPRADGPVSAKPVAVADGPSAVWSGTGFVVSAARSTAAPGRRITRNIWTWD